jgi:4'-phosphopantetheinyl transferase
METLPPEAIHVWMMRRPNDDVGLSDLTTEAELHYADTLSSSKRRCEWLAGRALLRYCLAHYTGENALALMFDKTEAGKPFLNLPDAPVFNLSHGPGWIACAVTNAESIGIDIDSDARQNRTDDIAARYYHPLEQAVLAQANDEMQRKRIFFRQWTLKEAYIKALGETINSMRLQELAFECAEGKSPQAIFSLPAGNWQFKHWRFDEDHHLALACQQTQCDTGSVDSLRYRFWLWDTVAQSRRELTDEWPCKI